MLRYLIVLLDDTSTSFCHYTASNKEPNLISLDILRKAIRWAMTENLTIQFVYPSHELLDEWNETIETIDHVKIKPATAASTSDADVVVFEGLEAIDMPLSKRDVSIVIRTRMSDFLDKHDRLHKLLAQANRLNVVFTDVDSFADDDHKAYDEALASLSLVVKNKYVNNHPVQFNLLTDRIMLTEMNNCGAGNSTITLAPDGQFYVCPAFYYDADGYPVGNIEGRLDIPNKQLYRLQYAPICRRCDAYQCHRCIWLNRKTTLEVNTPSHEQCVVAHIERNASRRLLEAIRQEGEFMSGTEIEEIDYLDPFEIARP